MGTIRVRMAARASRPALGVTTLPGRAEPPGGPLPRLRSRGREDGPDLGILQQSRASLGCLEDLLDPFLRRLQAVLLQPPDDVGPPAHRANPNPLLAPEVRGRNP